MSAAPCTRRSCSRAPSLRDREIHRLVKVSCKLQCDVAKEFHVCAGTVSRIVKRVQAWRSNAGGGLRGGADAPEAPGELSYAAERRLGRWLAQQRAEEMYGLARRLVAETEGGGKEPGAGGQEPEAGGQQDLRRMAVHLQAIKTALKAAMDAHELSQAEPPPPPAPAEDAKAWRKRTIDALARERQAAEAAGKVPKAGNPWSLVESLLAALVGGSQCLKPNNTHGPGTAYGQVASDLVSGSRDDRTLRERYGAEPSSAPEAQGAQARNCDLREEGADAAAGSVGATAGEDAPYGDAAAAAESVYPDTSGVENPDILRAQVADIVARSASEGIAEGPPPSDGTPITLAGAAGYDYPPLTGSPLTSPPAQVPRDEHAPPGPARQAGPTGIEVVGSPEWQAARAQWLAERDERRIDELAREYREKAEREDDLRARRAAAAQRRAWLDAGRIVW